MMRTLVSMTKAAVVAGALMMGVTSTPAQAQVEISLVPPVWFRATARPVFHEGRATYWYNNRWYYRNGNDWDYYREEPVYLRDYRGHRGFDRERQHYERQRGNRGGHRR
jgi:hypothetical protein